MPDPQQQQTTQAPPIDYDALAKQNGAISSAAPSVDYDALAQQHGAVSSTAPPTPAVSAGGKGRALIMGPGGPIFTDVPEGTEASNEQAGREGNAQGGAVGSALLTVPALIAAPGATLGGLVGGYLGGKGAKAAAAHLGADPDIQSLSELGGNLFGGVAGGMAGDYAGGKISGALPSAEHAGAQLQAVKGAAGDIPIDMTKPGATALQLYEQSQRGASLPMAVRKLVIRATTPDSEPITYAEAKDFQSNISSLSANEKMSLKPNIVRLLGQLNSDLKDSLTNAADTVGKGQQFQDAMKEYHNAMTLRGYTDQAKAAAIKAGLTAAGLYGLKQFLGIGQ